MIKRILLLTIFAMPTLFGASSSNNKQITKKKFEHLAQDFANAINSFNRITKMNSSKKILKLHKTLRKNYETETQALTSSLEFKKLILDTLGAKNKPTDLLDCFVRHSPIWKRLRKSSKQKLQQEYKRDKEKTKKERKANLQKLRETQERQNALEKAKQELLNQIALYEYAQNKNTACADINNAYNKLQKLNSEAAQTFINKSQEFTKLFDSLRTTAGLQYLKELKPIYAHNATYTQDALIRKADQAQQMVLFDDVNNNFGGISQQQTIAPQTDLDTVLQASMLTLQQEQQNINLSLSDEERLQIALTESQQQYHSKNSPSSSSNQQLNQGSNANNLNSAKAMAKVLLASKESNEQIIHIKNTTTEIVKEIEKTHTLTNNERQELKQYVINLTENNDSGDSSDYSDDDGEKLKAATTLSLQSTQKKNDSHNLDEIQEQQEPEQNNNTSLFVGGAITTAVIAGIIFLFTNK